MDKLLELFKKDKFEDNVEIESGYTKVLDWYIEIKKGNHAQYIQLFWKQNCDLNVCISKAYIFLTNWLLENYGGY